MQLAKINNFSLEEHLVPLYHITNTCFIHICVPVRGFNGYNVQLSYSGVCHLTQVIVAFSLKKAGIVLNSVSVSTSVAEVV